MGPEKNSPAHCRLFIAIPVPDKYRSILASQESANNGMPDFRWVTPENLHVTVFFIGNTPIAHIPEIENIIKECVDATSPFELKYSGVELQGRESKPRMVWVRFEKNAGFTNLSANLSKYLEPLGITPSRYQEPIPHITLARIRNGVVPLVTPVTGEDILFTGCELWRSTQTSNGVRYESIFRYYPGANNG